MPGPTREYSWWKENHDLGTLLLKFKGSQASEPRDKIYALLGIASDRPTKDLPVPNFPAPNYEKNEVAAVQDAIRFLLQLHTGIEGKIYSPAWTLADFMQRLDQLANETCAQAAGDGSVATVGFLLGTGKADPDFKNTEGQTPLLRAAKEGHESIVKILLKTGKVDVNFQDKERQTPLLRAAERGHESIVKLLLNTKKVAPDLKNMEGQTPLLRAAEEGHESIVKALLDTEEVDINVQDKEGQTPLLLAAEKGHESIVETLLNTHKGLVDVQNNNGQTPLARATRNGHTRVVGLLVERGEANVNVQDLHGRTPLIEASINGDEAAIKCILNTGVCDTEMRDNNLWNPFTTAAINGHETVVRRLLQSREMRSSTFAQKAALEKAKKLTFELFQTYEADRKSQKQYFSQHPIAAAVTTGNMTLLELFLETTPLDLTTTYIGANSVGTRRFMIDEAVWNLSEIPLILWAARNGFKQAVEALLGTVKTELTSRSAWAEGLLRLAVKTGDDRLIRLVVAKHRANVLQYGLSGPVLFDIAKNYGNLAVTEALLDSGWSDELSSANALLQAGKVGSLSVIKRILHTDKACRYLDILHSRGTPMLQKMAWYHHSNAVTAVFKILLDTPGIKVDLPDSCKRTPLIVAARRGLTDVVKLLLKTNNVDVNATDIEGRTPLLSAAMNGYPDVVRLLLETTCANVNARDENGMSSLDHAKRFKSKETAELLEKYGAV
ncbi:hypothetical protein G6514_002170 [Epicoccum nigrum]|nr:hypothetical protein G6514_002170 [Epicoccum nigrum]